ncbi:ABC transporter, permease protein [Lachnospiraceae bacterium KM106-2]|nr:ABC transporter, permease protein [Lachnospiraceae bacterium KM106-2]
MDRILFRRVFRELKKNLISYLALFGMILVGMYLVMSVISAAENVISGVDENAKKNQLEDGEFSTISELPDETLSKLKEKGITIEKQYYFDYDVMKDGVLRVFRNRKEINLVRLDSGRLAQKENEVVLEKQFAKKNNLKVQDSIQIGGRSYTITGIGSTPDYDCMLKTTADSNAESSKFGTAFLTKESYEHLRKEGKNHRSQQFYYSYQLHKKESADSLKRQLEKTQLLKEFIKQTENPRIKASKDDVIINKYAGIAAGVIVMILFTYVISIFVVHNIEKDSEVIGTLYAQGIAKRNILTHYLTLPVLITMMAGIIGTMIGLSKIGSGVQMQDTLDYFSLAQPAYTYPLYLIIYGMFMPPVVSAIVNIIVMNQMLNRPVLSMLRKEAPKRHLKQIPLNHMKFVHRFQIRQFLREIRSGLAIVFGMFIALLVIMLGLDCYTICKNQSDEFRNDTKYQYMYSYQLPPEKVPNGGEAIYVETFQKKVLGYDQDVSLMGIDSTNKYFPFHLKKGTARVAISSSAATKFNLGIGDCLSIKNKVSGKKYTFVIDKVVPYSVGLTLFMDIDSMRELFYQKNRYFNAVLSDHKLSIPDEKIYSITTRKEVVRSSDVFINSMRSMVITLLIVAIGIFIGVMYLMVNVMIERSGFHISLMKVFGYENREVQKFYLDGNGYLVAIAALFCIPLAKKVMDMVYPYLIANVSCGMNLTFSWWMYGVVYLGVVLCFFLVKELLLAKLNKILPAEVLKNRE